MKHVRNQARAAAWIETLENRQLLSAGPARVMENLGRGLIAMPTSSTNVFLSWRLLGLDPAGIGFNVYRSVNGGAATKINGIFPLTGGTNFTDASASTSQTLTYHVRPVISGVEQAPSAAYTLAPNTPVQPFFSIPLRNISGTASDYYVHLSWVGDLDGDGEYDFVVDRIPTIANTSDKVEAYKRDGTLLWAVDMGPNSLNKNNIEPGSSTLSVGNWDGVTVYDLDLDGKAEVCLRTANGVIFGNGATLTGGATDNHQFISILNGMTGAEKARIAVPTDYLSDGPMACSMGVGYLNGVTPSLVMKMKNRIGSGAFNMMVLALDYDGTNLTQKWKWKRGSTDAPDGHQIRLIDVDQDGRDEFVDIGFVLDGGGTLKYSLGPTVIHGDRYHIGDLDPDRPGLEGFGVQQVNPSGLEEYYYDAATGQILHQHFASPSFDNGRGIAADIDPAHRGYEYWSFMGIYNSKTVNGVTTETKITDEPNRPWPNFRIWWDGDVLSENLNNTRVEKWVPSTFGNTRLLSAHNYSAVDSWREAPTFYGDIFGDWREEIIYEKSDHTQLMIFSTTTSSSTRIYTLAQNPAYRNSMTIKGYMQSHMVDYYLGDGMTTPPTPNIVYQGSNPPPVKYTYQAETASIGSGTTVQTANSGYNGTGYVDFPLAGSSGFLQFNNVNGGAGGWVTLLFRNALSSGTRTGTLTINGVSQSITFNSSTSFTNWVDKGIAVNLNPGATNTIRLQSAGTDLPNVDQLIIVGFADIVAPTISNAVHGYDTAANTLGFTFSEAVTIDSDDIILTFLGAGGGNITPTGFNYSSGVATYTLPTGLADGNYRVTFTSGQVKDSSDNVLASTYYFDFFVFAGDANHDRHVNVLDSYALGTNWYGTGKTYSQGDFNYDGIVDAADLGIMGTKWLQWLDAAPPPPPPPPAPAESVTKTVVLKREPVRSSAVPPAQAQPVVATFSTQPITAAPVTTRVLTRTAVQPLVRTIGL